MLSAWVGMLLKGPPRALQTRPTVDESAYRRPALDPATRCHGRTDATPDILLLPLWRKTSAHFCGVGLFVIINQMTRSQSPKVLFVVGAPNWAHDYKTRSLQRALGDEYQILKRIQSDLTEADLDS